MIELTARELLIHLYQSAVDAVDGRHLVQQWCLDHAFPFTHCIAIGKAAASMLQGALDSRRMLQNALLITTSENIPRTLRKDKHVKVQASSHPVPDQSSLDAGAALLSYVENIPAGSDVLVLISGGTSSLVEAPVNGCTLEQLQQVNQHLLASGMDIHAINAWRKRFSQIKGGGLLGRVQHLNITQLLLSDVKGNDPAVIGSGLLVQSDKNELIEDAALESLLSTIESNTSVTAEQNYPSVDTFIIGSNEMAAQVVVEEAQRHGLESYYHEEFLQGDAVEQGSMLGEYLISAEPGVHVWGGETTVQLPDRPGLGGRNQSLVLSLATAIEGMDGLSVLAAGTDGIDGNTPCAGAVVSGNTALQARQMGFDVTAELHKANAGTVLMAVNELFKPGPTNTNVMDLVIAYKQ